MPYQSLPVADILIPLQTIYFRVDILIQVELIGQYSQTIQLLMVGLWIVAAVLMTARKTL